MPSQQRTLLGCRGSLGWPFHARLLWFGASRHTGGASRPWLRAPAWRGAAAVAVAASGFPMAGVVIGSGLFMKEPGGY